MGTWGVRPFENDTAADLLVSEIETVGKLIKKTSGDERSQLVEYQRVLIETSRDSDILGGYSGKRKKSSAIVFGEGSPSILRKIRSILRMIAAERDTDYIFAGMGFLAILAGSHTLTNAIRLQDLRRVIAAATQTLLLEAAYWDDPAERRAAVEETVRLIERGVA